MTSPRPSRPFRPIAVVGQACVLPGAPSPAALWDVVSQGRDVVTDVPGGRFRIDPALVAGEHGRPGAAVDKTWSSRGGYVRGFSFDAAGLDLPPGDAAGLDPLFHWVLATGRDALIDAGFDVPLRGLRAGAVLGNLSFPTEAMTLLGEQDLVDRIFGPGARAALGHPWSAPGDPRDRFMSGLPAHLLARALHLEAGAFCLDAACASSLYALRLAALALDEGRADVMLAGAVNRADSLFLHVGFCALQALSPGGVPRPFDQKADGLVPAEGCGAVALMRLDDAVRQGRKILGVIRGIGLSNDGRSKNLLAPSSEGQVRALRAAWASAGLDPAAPAALDYLECHATGTPTGDRTEVQSLAEVFTDGSRPIPVGSLKANVGHLITAAGVAGLMKVLGAFEHEELPPSLHADEPLDLLDGRLPFAVQRQRAPWRAVDGRPRRAGVSAFGFGGNNAHVVLEEHRPGRTVVQVPVDGSKTSKVKLAVVAAGVRLGAVRDLAGLARAFAEKQVPPAPLEIALDGVRFPPNDLQASLAQQLLVFEAARDAVASLGAAGDAALPSTRTGVLIGMGTDVRVTTPGLRWRAPAIARRLAPELIGTAEGAAFLAAVRDAAMRPLDAQGVLGCMPNIPANRLNVQLDLRGPGFTVSAEELSGLAGLDVARALLAAGELDAALVGAVDACDDPRHAQALAALRPSGAPAEGAIVLVVMDEERARAQGLAVLAVLDDVREDGREDGGEDGRGDGRAAPRDEVLDDARVRARLGDVHAAAGLLAVALGVARAHGGESGKARTRVEVQGLGGAAGAVTVRPAEAAGGLAAATTPEVGAAPARAAPARTLRLPPVPLPVPVPVPAHRLELMTPPPPLPRILPPAATETAEDDTSMSLEISVPGGLGADLDLTLDPAVAALRALRQDALAAHQGALAAMTRAHEEFLAHRTALMQRFAALGAAVGDTAGVDGLVDEGVVGERVVGERVVGERVVGESVLWDRPALERLASGRISDVWGEVFRVQDGFRRQVRMPEPPLLLADRVMAIDARPGVLEKDRSIVSETDLRWDSWYLHEGRCPAGILIETGQADLLLVSYMGVDFENQGERVYRLLGCDLTYQGPLPAAGTTLQHDIHVDGYATAPMKGGEVRIFFFHSDTYALDEHGARGELVLSVRNGQAGFFTDAELADSGGVLWTPADVKPEVLAAAPWEAPPRPTTKRALSRDELVAFSEGDALTCFGAGFERAATHVRTPRIPSGPLLLVDRVTELDLSGGPWGRGFLRAELDLTGDNWFFAGHFKDDPCMPGTVMFEGCLETLGVYLAACGFTIDKDGFRFEPGTEKAFKLRCRGQAIPSSRHLVYEVFVRSLVGGPEPSVTADVLVTVDGLKSLHCEAVELRLVRDWPLSSRPDLLGTAPKASDEDAVGGVGSNAPAVFDQTALLATGIGRPSQGFPGLYESFDAPRPGDASRVPRLPGPPYHFMSRVVDVGGPPQGALARGEDATGTRVTVEYDVPPDAWFFRETARSQGGTMPFAVLLEVALQPCGFVSSIVGSALTTSQPLYYRNLDGTSRLYREVGPDAGTLVIRAELLKSSSSGGMIIQELSFAVATREGAPVFDGTTVFGFFPAEALARQVGAGSTPEERARLAERQAGFDVVDLAARPGRYFDDALALPDPMLLMIDRVTAYAPHASPAGLARVRTEKSIDPREWFFRAHFFQDPVQPGSLGIEAMIQALMWTAIHEGRHRGLRRPRFEALATGEAVVWKYRGQVIPENRLVQVELDLVAVEEDRRRGGVTLRANASLWVDGTKIYVAQSTAGALALRIVDDA